MDGLQLAHTADLGAGTLAALRGLLEGVFEGDFAEDDWEHGLGGMHAVAWEAGEPVAHGSVVQRRLLHGGRALRCGYVEGVGTRADRRRRGHGDAVMAALERIVRGAYDLGALGATDAGAALYGKRGWQRWRGPTSVLAPEGVRPTPDADGNVFVFATATALDLDGELTCDWREGDVW